MNEFMRIDHTVFPPGGSSGERPTPPTGLKESFVFKDYAPLIFNKIRDRFNVDAGMQHLNRSICVYVHFNIISLFNFLFNSLFNSPFSLSLSLSLSFSLSLSLYCR